MTEEGRARRKALSERLKAKRRAKEAEIERTGAAERERCDLDADLTVLEELETEVNMGIRSQNVDSCCKTSKSLEQS